MVIWARWGILGLLIPVALILIIQAVMVPKHTVDPKSPARANVTDESEAPPTEEEVAEKKVADRKRVADHLKAVKRARENAWGIGCLIAAGVLWPLGRWMNKTESRLLVDPQTG